MKHLLYYETMGWNLAMYGMRNPKNSWDKGDSSVDDYENFVEIGPNDMKLAKALIIGGPEHRKFLRMIHVQANVVFSRAIWSEFDTYHFVTKNSCSTMHKLFEKNKDITMDAFNTEGLTDEEIALLNNTISYLNKMKIEYFDPANTSKQSEILGRAKKLLPEGFLQMRTIDTNYEELATIYRQRKNHRMKEWRDFCKELEILPYFKEFIVQEKEEKNND